jgi:hypothetical protein
VRLDGVIAREEPESGQASRRLMGGGVAVGRVLLLGGLGYFAVTHFLARYLEGEKLRNLIAGRVARELSGEAASGRCPGADCRFIPRERW